jgi:hypothetical protein
MTVFDAAYRTPTYEFRVRTPLLDVARRLDQLLAPFALSRANGVPIYELRPRRGASVHVYLDGILVLRSDSHAAAFDYVLWRISTETIERASGFVVLHAGAVSWRRRGLVLPGPPDAGKTTLTAGLVRAGFRYLTDEAALVEPITGRLHPFPRPLWMDPGTLDVIPGLREGLPRFLEVPRISYHIDPFDLRPGSIGSPCTIRFIVAPTYLESAATRLEPLSRAEAVVLLARNSFNVASGGPGAIELLAQVARDARCFRLVMGDLDSAVDAVSSLVKGADPAA